MRDAVSRVNGVTYERGTRCDGGERRRFSHRGVAMSNMPVIQWCDARKGGRVVRRNRRRIRRNWRRAHLHTLDRESEGECEVKGYRRPC